MGKNEKQKENLNIEDLPKLWDEYAAFYEKTFGRIQVFKGFAKKIEKYLLPVPKGVILDAGCGPGLHFEKIIQISNPLRLIGIDISLKMLEEAKKMKEKLREKYKCKIDLKKVDLCEGIPFTDNFFDIQLYHLVLYYLPAKKWQYVLEEAFRVAKPGGYVISTSATGKFDFKKEIGILGILKQMLTAPIATSLFVLKVKPIFMKLQEMQNKGMLCYPSLDELRSVHESLGFKDIVLENIWKDNMIIIRARKP